MNESPGAGNTEWDRTQVFGNTSARGPARAAPRLHWVHSLRVVDGPVTGLRQRVDSDEVTIGRREGLVLTLADREVSSLHCSVRALPGEDALLVTDHRSTNGTFVDGQRVQAEARLPDHGLLQVGGHVLLHEFRPQEDMERAEQADRDLARARHYVEAMLPPPLREGPVQTEWFYRPSATLGGDAFGVLDLGDGRHAGYVIDVCGHGAGAAMHTVSVMSVLRQRALPQTDLADPAQVLARLNAMFQMDAHDGLYFTMWYGAYETASRTLTYASAGHHPAYVRGADGQPLQALATRSLAIGAMPDSAFTSQARTMAPGDRLYLFSDGLFEVQTVGGRAWTLADLLPLIERSDRQPGEPERLYRAVRKATGERPLEDDCSIITVTFL